MPVPVREHSGQTVIFFDGFFVQLNGSGCFSEVTTSLMRFFFRTVQVAIRLALVFTVKRSHVASVVGRGKILFQGRQ